MGFESVTVEGKPWDGGIDLRAERTEVTMGERTERRRYIVQCKRVRDPVDAREVREFVARALQAEGEAHGLFVTTSSFTPAARAERSSHRLHLMDGVELQEHLDRFLGPGLYCLQ